MTVDMVEYVTSMLEEFPIKFKDGELAANPAAVDMFNPGDKKYLETEQQELFHRTTAMALFVCK